MGWSVVNVSTLSAVSGHAFVVFFSVYDVSVVHVSTLSAELSEISMVFVHVLYNE